MTTISRTLFFLSLAPVLCGAAQLHGTILDPQNAAIPGAQVSLVSRDNTLRLAVSTDGAGAYLFTAVPAGRYVLEAQAEGFGAGQALVVDLAESADRRVDVPLPVAAIRTQVVVTASGTPQTTDEVSKALTIVDTETAATRGEFFLSDALRDVPGIRVERLGGPGAMTSIRTRGLRPEDTALLVDGFRIRDAAAPQGDASGFLSDVLVTDADRMEVLRGAGSSLYGSNATGGVVNIVTAEGGGRTRGGVLLEGGSLGLFRGRAQLAGALGQRFHYSAGVAHLNVISGVDGDDPSRTTALQSRTDYLVSAKARLSGRIFFTDAFAKLNSNPLAASGIPASGIVDAVPNVTFLPSPDNPDNTRAARVFSGALSLALRPAETVGVTLSYQGLVSRRRFGDGPAGYGYQPSASTNSWYDGDVHTAGARLDWRAGRHHSVNAGYEFESEAYGNRGLDPDVEGLSSVAVTERSSSAYLQDQVSLLDGRLQFAGSWRGQWFTLSQPVLRPITDAPYKGMSFAAPPTAQTGDGSAAYLLRRTGTKLRAHVGKGYRAPSLYERFGAYYGSFGYSAYGDPRLRPDRTLAVDAGFDQMFGARARLSATYFYTWLQEVVIFDFSGAISPAVDPYGRYGGYRNTRGGLARGAELSGSVTPTRRLTLHGAYTYTNSVQRVPLVEDILRTFVTPAHQYSASATERLSDRLTLFFSYTGSGDYLAPVFDANTFSSRAYRFQGANRAQAGANYRLPLGEFRAIRFTGKVDNLFNQDYYESGFRTPGATATGGMQFEF
ncbi:MAG: TonB-dependent receptor [Proteobacteria bacterium]|nr:TonB-dependent receptor [Pseudomonadota bacterium]